MLDKHHILSDRNDLKKEIEAFNLAPNKRPYLTKDKQLWLCFPHSIPKDTTHSFYFFGNNWDNSEHNYKAKNPNEAHTYYLIADNLDTDSVFFDEIEKFFNKMDYTLMNHPVSLATVIEFNLDDEAFAEYINSIGGSIKPNQYVIAPIKMAKRFD